MQVTVHAALPTGGQPFEVIERRVAESIRRAMNHVGQLVKRVAVSYAPISPSMSLLRKFRKVKGGDRAGSSIMLTDNQGRRQEVTMTEFYAGRETRHATPGGLMRSISYAVLESSAEVFVPSNSEAGKYARRIHDEKGISWWHRGPGTQAKGAQADALFIERAITDSKPNIQKIIDVEMQRVTK